MMLFNFLPFIIGRNILEVNLINKEEIYGFAIFDVQYFVPIYLSDLFLLMIYQDYFSGKFFGKRSKFKQIKVSYPYKIALINLISFLLLIVLRSINHEFGSLLILRSSIIVKFILLFALPIIVDLRSHKQLIYQTIASISFFQAILIFIEQIKGGNIGRFIENTLPGIELGTQAAEARDLLRADGTFNEPNVAAIFLLMNSVILIEVALQNFKTAKKQSYLYLLVSILSLVAIIFTGSRSLYALSFCYLLFYFIKYKKSILQFSKKFLKQKLVWSVSLLAAAIILPYLSTRISSITNVFSDNGSFSYRLALNNAVLSMAFASPLGIGLDLTPYYLAKNFKTVDNQWLIFDQAPAHNIIVQVLTETGIFACLIFLFFVYYTLRNTLMKKNIGFALAALVYFLAAQFHPVFTNHYELTAFFFLYLGLGLNLNEK